jgi:hypothetical protein
LIHIHVKMYDMRKEGTNNIEQILESLDGVERASAPDFFYTRLLARMQNETFEPKRTAFLPRPALAFTAMLVILLVNIFVVFQNRGNNTETSNTDTDSVQMLASEYSISDPGNVYELNIEK